MLKNSDLALIKNIIQFGDNEIKFNVQKMLNVSEVFNLFNFSLSSKDIHSFVVDFNFLSADQSYNTFVFLNDFKCKYFFLQLSVYKVVIITLSHDY